MVQDFETVFEFMTGPLQMADYRIFISMAKKQESFKRDFRGANLTYQGAIQLHTDLKPECEIMVNQYKDFANRMLDRFNRDVVESLSKDSFRD